MQLVEYSSQLTLEDLDVHKAKVAGLSILKDITLSKEVSLSSLSIRLKTIVSKTIKLRPKQNGLSDLVADGTKFAGYNTRRRYLFGYSF
jgi:hypothetical protein